MRNVFVSNRQQVQNQRYTALSTQCNTIQVLEFVFILGSSVVTLFRLEY